MIDAFPLIEVSGPPRERGRQYGRQAAGRIARGVEHYTAQLERGSFGWDGIRRLVADFVPHIERFEPAHVEEMRGIALAKLQDTGIANTPCTLYRDLRVRQLLTPGLGRLTVDSIKSALFDDFATPWSVCRPPRAGVTGSITASVAMIVMEPALGVMEVAPLPALNRRFTTYRLEAARGATALVAG